MLVMVPCSGNVSFKENSTEWMVIVAGPAAVEWATSWVATSPYMSKNEAIHQAPFGNVRVSRTFVQLHIDIRDDDR